jgi:hypothetical protein
MEKAQALPVLIVRLLKTILNQKRCKWSSLRLKMRLQVKRRKLLAKLKRIQGSVVTKAQVRLI